MWNEHDKVVASKKSDCNIINLSNNLGKSFLQSKNEREVIDNGTYCVEVLLVSPYHVNPKCDTLSLTHARIHGFFFFLFFFNHM